VFNATFSYIVAISFIGGVKQSIWRKPSTCHKPLTNSHNVQLEKEEDVPSKIVIKKKI